MRKDGKPRVVIDINLLISAIISKGNSSPSQLLTVWRNKKIDLVLTDNLLAEIEAVFNREKIFKTYHISLNQRALLLKELRNSTDIVMPIKRDALPLNSRDKKDDMLLMCAFGGNCDYLVTGDMDLLVLQGRPELGSLRIVKATELLALLI
jgi:putative PIN family toxin of toxin-antitoxin system